jgi:superfamily II DNA or RNA helicase
MHALRDYQRHAIEALKERWKDDDARRLAIVLPTGGGKTVVFAHLCADLLRQNPAGRVLVLVHTDELVRQAVEKINDHAPELIVGVVKAKENETTADVIVGSVQTLRNKRRRDQLRNVVAVIVDECHHAAATTYMTILNHFGCFDPKGARAIGFTATLVRGDDKSLSTVWQDVPFSRDISWMIRKRYLIPVGGKAVQVPDLNLRDVKSTRKDFREGELGEALADSLAPELIVKAYLEHAPDRKAILFAPTVASATVFAEAFSDLGVSCEVVHGALKQDVRDAILARHRAGITKVIANCMVLTEGYDDPEVDCIIVARPTKSKGLYIQMVGRGLRVDPARPYDDQDCLILDVVGANALHDLRSVIDLSEKKLDPQKAREGKTLTELEDEFDAGEGVEEDAPVFYQGDVEIREFDPLGKVNPSKVWLKTERGHHFLPAGTGAYVFLMAWPRPDVWSVAMCAREPSGVVERGGVTRSVLTTEYRALSLEDAMLAAEDIALDLGAASMNLANKKAPWRRGPVSEKMKNMAKALGISVSDADTAGKVSDRITKMTGTRRIDPLVWKVTGR